MQTIKFNVTGMSCAGCARAVGGALKRVPGVETAQVELGENSATVVYDDTAVALEQLIAAVQQAGYGASLAKGT